MNINYIFNIVLLLLITNLSAQSVCQEQLEINNDVSGFSIGQSIFMSDCSGLFNSIELSRSDDGPEMVAELVIFTGQTFMGTPRYTQTVTIPGGSGAFTINFSNGIGTLAFFEESQYTFMLNNPLLQLESTSDINSYTDGQLFLDLGFINNSDLWFRLSTNSTLGINNNELDELSLFPNPANDYFQISGIIQNENFAIYNVLGMKVMNGIVSKDEKINIQNLPVGLYYLKLNVGKALKFLKK